MTENNIVKIQNGKVFIDDKEIHNLDSLYISDGNKQCNVRISFKVNEETK